MFKIFSFLLVVFTAAFSVSAQCNGVYFKETARQVLSNSFATAYFEDFDNDGKIDILGYTPTVSNQIQFYKRLGATSIDTNAKTSSIGNFRDDFGIFGDVNNDGFKDIIISHPTTPPILTTYLNDGTGRFLTTTPGVNIIPNERFIFAGDLNSDGKADVLSTAPAGNLTTLYYRLAQTDNSFGEAVAIATFSGYLQHSGFGFTRSIVIDDLNGNGFKDIALALQTNSNSNRFLKVFTNSGNLNFSETANVNFTISGNKLQAVDLNNDGKKDFVSRVDENQSNPDVRYIRILANNGANSFSATEIIVPSKYSFSNSLGDFDSDGLIDIIVPGAGSYLLLKNQGNFNFSQQEFKSFLKIDSVEQINGDGKADALTLVRPFIDGDLYIPHLNSVYFMYNAVRFRENVCNPIGQTKTVDFDGDGFIDRAFWNPSTGIWRYYTGNTQNEQVYFQWGSGALNDVPVPNDFDGDGQTDYAVYRKSDGNWWIFRSSDQQVSTVKFGIEEDKPIPADFDGDGKADIAVYRPSEGIWYILLSQSNQFKAVRFGLPEDIPLPADYDGDGKADIAVYRPSTGVWYRLNSSDDSFFAVQFGISTDKPVPADYDGNGKANVAVFRDGVWYVLRENYTTSVFYWGTANDIPFFGENNSPTAFVYRRTNSNIYSIKFTTVYGGLYDTFSTGNAFNEIMVSSILPIQ